MRLVSSALCPAVLHLLLCHCNQLSCSSPQFFHSILISILLHVAAILHLMLTVHAPGRAQHKNMHACMHLNSWEMGSKNYCTLGGYLLFWTLEVWIHHIHSFVQMQVIPLESQNKAKIPITLTSWLRESESVLKKSSDIRTCSYATRIYQHHSCTPYCMQVIRLIHRTRKESVHANNQRLILFFLGVWQQNLRIFLLFSAQKKLLKKRQWYVQFLQSSKNFTRFPITSNLWTHA
jgi:hypothetical protein